MEHHDDPQLPSIGRSPLSGEMVRVDATPKSKSSKPRLTTSHIESKTSNDDLGTIPDIRVPSEFAIWKSSLTAGVLVELPTMEPSIARNLAKQISVGLKGRGTCGVSPRGRLFASFAVTPDEAEQGFLLSEYSRQLLEHLGLPAESLIGQGINDIALDPDTIADADRVLRSLGLRALN